MKNSFLIVVLVISCAFGQAQATANAAKHLGAGAVIGAAGGYAAHKVFKGQRGWTWAGAVGSSLAAGLAKETYDKSNSGIWQTDDVLYTTLGGVISGLALELLFKNTYRRSSRSGRNRGCLVAYENNSNSPFLPLVNENGSGSIQSEIQISYF